MRFPTRKAQSSTGREAVSTLRVPKSSSEDDPAPFDSPGLTEKPHKGLWIGQVLLFQDPSGQRLGRIVVEHGDTALNHDRPAVEPGVDEVDGATRDTGTVLDHLLVHVQAGERGEQARMDVEDPLGVVLDEIATEKSHVACQAHPVDFRLLESCQHLALVGGTARLSPVRHDLRRDSSLFRAFQALGSWLIAQHQHDLCRNTTVVDRVLQREIVTPAAREKNGHSRSLSILTSAILTSQAHSI